jgi:hypothetical protein
MAAIAKECASGRTDEALAALAGRQYGVVARRQLRELGLSDGAIAHRLAAGRLHRVHHGVYAVGHTMLVRRGRLMAAVLACGDGAVLSHAAAGALWELRASEATIVDVTVPGSGGGAGGAGSGCIGRVASTGRPSRRTACRSPPLPAPSSISPPSSTAVLCNASSTGRRTRD